MNEYIITRSNELAHFGIKGQKWGVRRYENEDGTLTEAGKIRYGTSNGGSGNEKLAKKYAKSVKQLKKAYENADLSKQVQDYAKYEKRAKTSSRIGKAALAVGLPAVATSFATDINTRSQVRSGLKEVNDLAANSHWGLRFSQDDYKYYYAKYVNDPANNIFSPNRSYDEMLNAHEKIADATNRALRDMTSEESNKLAAKVNNVSTVVADVAAVTAGVSFGVAAYSKIRSSMAKRLINEKGHEKAVAKAKDLTEKMSKTFANTPYSLMLKTQVNVYKEEHPNTQMSDKEILKALMPLT